MQHVGICARDGGGWRWRCQPSSAEIDNPGLVCVHTFAASKGTRKKRSKEKRRRRRAVKRHHKSRRPIRDTPLATQPSRSPYDPGRSETAGCLSGRSLPVQGPSPVSRCSPVESPPEKKMLAEVFIGSFRGTKRRRCPPPYQASIRRWSSPLQPTYSYWKGTTTWHAPRRRGG